MLFKYDAITDDFKSVILGHDNSGLSPGWFLDKVVIDDTMMSCVYTFPCQRWFATDEDDGRLTRELVPGRGDAGIPYTVEVHTGLKIVLVLLGFVFQFVFSFSIN